MATIEDKDFSSHITLHSLEVAQVAILLAHKKFDEEQFMIAAYLLDVGICIEKDGHIRHSFVLAKKAGFEITNVVKDCILNHGSSNSPLRPEGKIFQLADKLSAYNLNYLKFLMNKSDGIFDEKTFSSLEKNLKKIAKLI